jgi:hypothetical protein
MAPCEERTARPRGHDAILYAIGPPFPHAGHVDSLAFYYCWDAGGVENMDLSF